MNLSYRVYYVWKRNLYSFKRFVIPTLLISLGEPLFYLVAMGVGLGAYLGLLGGKPYLYFLAPGIVIASTMVSSAYECLYGSFIRMIHERIFDSLIITPISVEDAVAGDILWGTFRGVISGFLVLLVALLLGITPFSAGSIMILLVTMVITGILFSSLSMIITSFAPNFDFFNYYTELVITPMFFFSGVFFPLDRMPAWVKALSQLFPLTHAVLISRSGFSGTFNSSLVYNFLVLFFLGGIFFILAIQCMKHRLIQ